jgi:hypothetical protein
MPSDPSRLAKLHPSHNPLASYAELPAGVRYQDLEADEQVAVLLRRHPVTNMRWLVPAVLAAVVPLFWRLIPLEFLGLGVLNQIPAHIALVMVLFWYLLVIGYALENMLIWYYNVYLVTNKRIVDVDFHGLMHYASDEAALHQIQDVQHKQQGLWQLLFKYGTVHLQTSGTKQNLDFERVPQPSRVADIITDLLPIPEDVRHGQITVNTKAGSHG